MTGVQQTAKSSRVVKTVTRLAKMFNAGSIALWQTHMKFLAFLILEHLGDKKFSMVFLQDIPAVYDYWPVACLLLYPGNTLHHIKKPHSIQRN